MHTERRIYLFLLFAVLAIYFVFIPAGSVSAYDEKSAGTDVLSQLEQDAADRELTLSEYLWRMLNDDHSNLGDLAANQLIKLFEKGIEKSVDLGRETPVRMTIKSISSESSVYQPQAVFFVTLDDGEEIETGYLTVHGAAIKEYVNTILYPKIKQELNGKAGSGSLLEDLAALLENAGVSADDSLSVGFWNKVLNELTEGLSSYSVIENTLSTPSSRPLLTYTPEETPEQSSPSYVMAEIFRNVNSSEKVINALNRIEVPAESPDPEPVPDPTPNQPNVPDPHRDPVYTFLPDTQLPATGFSAGHFTRLQARPQGLVYGTTGLTLQIPELDVIESIVTVPEEDGIYPVDWLGRSIGLLEESSLPGEGITVLTGHNHLNTTEAGPFVFISSLAENDRLFIQDGENAIYSYSVYGNYKIPADGFASIMGNLKENSLVLITCEDESVEGGYLNRRIIFAEKLNIGL